VGDDAAQVDAHVDDRLRDRRVDAGEEALGPEEPNGARHPQEVIGGAGIHHLDAGDVDDGAVRLLLDDGAQERLGHLRAARRVEHADDREAEDALPDLDDRRRQLADRSALHLDHRELLLELLLIGAAPHLSLTERLDHLVDAVEERGDRVIAFELAREPSGVVAITDVGDDEEDVRDSIDDHLREVALGRGCDLRAHRPPARALLVLRASRTFSIVRSFIDTLDSLP